MWDKTVNGTSRNFTLPGLPEKGFSSLKAHTRVKKILGHYAKWAFRHSRTKIGTLVPKVCNQWPVLRIFSYNAACLMKMMCCFRGVLAPDQLVSSNVASVSSLFRAVS